MTSAQQTLLTSLKGRIVTESGSMRKAAKLVSQLERLYPDAVSYRANLIAMRRANRVGRKISTVTSSNSFDLFAL